MPLSTALSLYFGCLGFVLPVESMSLCILLERLWLPIVPEGVVFLVLCDV